MALLSLLLLGLLPLLCLSASLDFSQRYGARHGQRSKDRPPRPHPGNHTSDGRRHIRATLQSRKVNNVTGGTVSTYATSGVSDRSPREPLARYGEGIVYMMERTFRGSQMLKGCPLITQGSCHWDAWTDGLGHPRYRVVYVARGSGLYSSGRPAGLSDVRIL